DRDRCAPPGRTGRVEAASVASLPLGHVLPGLGHPLRPRGQATHDPTYPVAPAHVPPAPAQPDGRTILIWRRSSRRSGYRSRYSAFQRRLCVRWWRGTRATGRPARARLSIGASDRASGLAVGYPDRLEPARRPRTVARARRRDRAHRRRRGSPAGAGCSGDVGEAREANTWRDRLAVADEV